MLKCLTSEKTNIGYSKFTFTYSFFTLGTEVPGVSCFHKICMVVGYFVYRLHGKNGKADSSYYILGRINILYYILRKYNYKFK